MRGLTCALLGLAITLTGCGPNLGKRGDNSNKDRPRLTAPAEKPRRRVAKQ